MGQVIDNETGEEVKVESPAQQRSEDYVTPELEAKFASVFAKASGQDLKDVGEAPKPSKESTRRAAAKKEQEDEIVEEAQRGTKGKAAAAKTEEDESGEADDEVETVKPAGKKGVSATGGSEGGLDPAIRRQIERAGWTPEEIDELYEASPEIAQRQFSRILSQQSEAALRYAQAGRQRMEQQAAPARTATSKAPAKQTPATASEVLASLEDIDLDEFAENNGPDIVEKLVKPLQRELRELREVKEYYRTAQEDAIRREVIATFKELGAQDLYGGQNGQFSDEQAQARDKLLSAADAIRVGASIRGENLSVGEAIEMAHFALNRENAEASARTKLIAEVKKRSRAITSRPTSSRDPKTVSDGSNKSERAAMEAYRAAADQLGYDLGG